MKNVLIAALLGLASAEQLPLVQDGAMLGEGQWFTPGGWSYRYDRVEDNADLKDLFLGLQGDLEGRTN